MAETLSCAISFLSMQCGEGSERVTDGCITLINERYQVLRWMGRMGWKQRP
jgi:hypothetical protein